MKKALGIFLALMLLTHGAAARDAAGGGKSDMAFLKAVGILAEDFMPGEDCITRGEAAMVLAHCLGADAAVYEPVFTDVSEKAPYAGEITAVYRAGLLSGYGDGSFRPDEAVTYSQMVKLLVSLLGYEYQAQAMGGYPSGYLAVAVQKEIVKGAMPGGNAPLSEADMEKLVHRALDAPLCEAVSFENGYVDYAETDKTVLSAWHGIQKLEGIVTADFLASFDAERSVRKDEVAIDGKVYAIGKTNAAAYLCQKVQAYIGVETETVLYMEPAASNTVLKLPAADVLEVTDTKLRYKTDSGEKTVSLKDNAAVLKNGSRIPNRTAADLYFPNGQLTLVAPDGGAFSYILAEQYENRIVDYVDVKKNVVRFRDGGQLEIDPDGTQKTLFLEADGRAAELAYTYPWDVFSVMESENALKVIRSEMFVLGTVEELSDEGVVISGVYYDFAPGFMDDAEPVKPKLGMQAGFTFDYTGRLAAVNTGSGQTGSYGILISGETTKGLSPRVRLKIYTQDAKMQTFDAAEKVTLSDVSVKGTALLEDGSPLLENGTVKRQMVLYEQNAAGEISRIDTAQDYTYRTDDESRLDVFSRDLYINENRNAGYGDTIVYRDGNAEQFGAKYRVRRDTLVFVLPDEGAPDEDYGMMASYALLGGSRAKELNRVTLYDLDKMYNIAVMTWEKSTGSAEEPNQEHDKLFVAKTFTGLDADGMAARCIEGWDQDGQYRSLRIEDGLQTYFLKAYTDPEREDAALLENGAPKDRVPAAVVQAGDLIQFKASVSGLITWMNVVARGGSLPDCEISYDGYRAVLLPPNIHGRASCYVVAAGTVRYAASDAVVAETKNHLDRSETFIRIYPDSGVTLLYDKEKGTTEKISMRDIRPGDTVLNLATVQQEDFCIVYR